MDNSKKKILSCVLIGSGVLEDSDYNLRMDIKNFTLSCFLLHCFEKQKTCFKTPIPLEKRIAIALYSLGLSAEYRIIANTFGVENLPSLT
uniref:CSON008528 protein n=1 Tax=Culicoides sonorensis TaxID=179676 RepID=A0A336MX61_CULSO